MSGESRGQLECSGVRSFRLAGISVVCLRTRGRRQKRRSARRFACRLSAYGRVRDIQSSASRAQGVVRLVAGEHLVPRLGHYLDFVDGALRAEVARDENAVNALFRKPPQSLLERPRILALRDVDVGEDADLETEPAAVTCRADNLLSTAAASKRERRPCRQKTSP